LTEDSPAVPESDYRVKEPSLWAQNHGNLLLGFVAIIFLVGASYLFYQQTLSFAKPRFPVSVNILAVLTAVGAASGSALIRVVGAANDRGTMKIAIYGAESTFTRPTDAVFASVERITNGLVVVPVPLIGLPEKIAIAVFHDENDDSKLNTNAIGFPSERYGFSCNGGGLTGSPTREKTGLPCAGTDLTGEDFCRNTRCGHCT